MGNRRTLPGAGLLTWRGTAAGVLLSAAILIVPARADEIRFRTGSDVQRGTVLEEDGGFITIRFPRGAIESIVRDSGVREDMPERGKSPGLEERVRKLEKQWESLPSISEDPGSRQGWGDLEGSIRWKNVPLPHARVMVVPWNRAGRPPVGNEPGQPAVAGAEHLPEGAFETRTDAVGRYRFDRIPPGEYLLYWMPDEKAGWVRRMRDRADLVVVPGRTTILSIPEEGK